MSEIRVAQLCGHAGQHTFLVVDGDAQAAVIEFLATVFSPFHGHQAFAVGRLQTFGVDALCIVNMQAIATAQIGHHSIARHRAAASGIAHGSVAIAIQCDRAAAALAAAGKPFLAQQHGIWALALASQQCHEVARHPARSLAAHADIGEQVFAAGAVGLEQHRIPQGLVGLVIGRDGSDAFFAQGLGE